MTNDNNNIEFRAGSEMFLDFKEEKQLIRDHVLSVSDLDESKREQLEKTIEFHDKIRNMPLPHLSVREITLGMLDGKVPHHDVAYVLLGIIAQYFIEDTAWQIKKFLSDRDKV